MTPFWLTFENISSFTRNTELGLQNWGGPRACVGVMSPCRQVQEPGLWVTASGNVNIESGGHPRGREGDRGQETKCQTWQTTQADGWLDSGGGGSVREGIRRVTWWFPWKVNWCLAVSANDSIWRPGKLLCASVYYCCLRGTKRSVLLFHEGRALLQDRTCRKCISCPQNTGQQSLDEKFMIMIENMMKMPQQWRK